MKVRNFDWLPSGHTLTGHQTCNPVVCPDQKWNRWQPLVLQDEAQTTENTTEGKHSYLSKTVVMLTGGRENR